MDIPSDGLRVWCETIARSLQRHAIDRDGQDYLVRYFAAGWSPWNRAPGAAVYLHHFRASDPVGSVHSHPWKFSISVILVGGYKEYRCDDDGVQTSRVFHVGDVNVLLPDTKHRIELLGADCWTLFLAGPYQQDWSFFPECR